MYRRTVLGVMVGGVAGCVGRPDDGTDGGTTSGTERETTDGTDGKPAEPTSTVPESAVAAYDELSATEQAAFDTALDGEVRFSDSLPESYGSATQYDLGVREVFERNDYVRKDGRLYEVIVIGPVRVGGAGVSVTEVNASEADVQFEDLSGETADLIERAIEGDGLVREPEADPLEGVESGDVVEYEGEFYEVSPRIVDFGYFRLEVEPA